MFVRIVAVGRNRILETQTNIITKKGLFCSDLAKSVQISLNLSDPAVFYANLIYLFVTRHKVNSIITHTAKRRSIKTERFVRRVSDNFFMNGAP